MPSILSCSLGKFIERSEDDDLLKDSLWKELWEEIDNGLWDVVVLTPPCNTFSRAR